jgi:hypothetical protein
MPTDIKSSARSENTRLIVRATLNTVFDESLFLSLGAKQTSSATAHCTKLSQHYYSELNDCSAASQRLRFAEYVKATAQASAAGSVTDLRLRVTLSHGDAAD